MSESPRPVHFAVLPFIVAGTFFMEYLDTTIIATALPQMAKSFHAGPNDVSIGMTAYMLTLAIFIPLSGWVADRLGSRTVFATALVIFTLASVTCGFSTGIWSFTASRIVQGIGGSMMVPVGRMIVVRNTEKSQMMRAISTITWPAVIAPVVGPTVGGFITTYFSWHWIFYLNVPFGIIALAAIMRFVPEQREAARRPLDLAGFALTGCAFTLVLYGTEMASRRGENLAFAALVILAGLAFGLLALGHARRAAHPLLDYSILKARSFAVTTFSGSASRMGIEAVPYLSPLLFQLGFGLSPFHSGLLLLALATGNLGMKAFTTRILNAAGFRRVAVYNILVAAVFIAAIGWLTPATPLLLLLLVLFIYGLARSLQFTTLATLAFADVNEAQRGPASTLQSVAQQMSMGLGTAFGALALRSSFLPFPAGPRSFPLINFRWAFAMAGLLTLCSVAGYLRLAPDAGDTIRRSKART